jgi:RNA polymerase sigma factor (sigma-70 family)
MTRAAIEQLYRSHGHIALRRARALLRTETEAQDACQEIFLGLLQRPEQLDGVTRLVAWLYRATTHHCLNKLRDRRGRIRILATLDPPLSTVPARSEDVARAHALLDRLPEPLGEIAVYHHLDGLTYDEIAALLGCSRRQVGYYLEALRAFVADDDCEPGVAPAWPKEQRS